MARAKPLDIVTIRKHTLGDDVGAFRVAQFEYKVINTARAVELDKDLAVGIAEHEAELNAMGAVGWELVHYQCYNTSTTTSQYRIWKRQL